MHIALSNLQLVGSIRFHLILFSKKHLSLFCFQILRWWKFVRGHVNKLCTADKWVWTCTQVQKYYYIKYLPSVILVFYVVKLQICQYMWIISITCTQLVAFYSFSKQPQCKRINIFFLCWCSFSYQFHRL